MRSKILYIINLAGLKNRMHFVTIIALTNCLPKISKLLIRYAFCPLSTHKLDKSSLKKQKRGEK